jgi:hypothetical protein
MREEITTGDSFIYRPHLRSLSDLINSMNELRNERSDASKLRSAYQFFAASASSEASG